MKKFLLSLLTLIILLPAFPQELKKMEIIGKARKLQSGEMVARRDQNGNYCAAIKVVSDMDGFSYDSFDGIVGEILDNPGEDIVYLTRNERVLKIFKSGYEPLQIILSDFGITLKEKEIWQIKIAGDEAADVLPVTFRFTPEDAELFIDGEKAGSEQTQNLSLGEHEIRLERDGYQSLEKTISVNDKQVFFELEMQKVQLVWLVMNTTPEGADVFIDEKYLGTTPFTQELWEGEHSYRVTTELYHDENGAVSLDARKGKEVLEFDMKPAFGYLNITSSPEAGAEIILDGVPINQQTPFQSGKIQSGSHTVLLTHKWYEDQTKEIVITDQETKEVTIEMQPRFAEVSISTHPEADIYIDGHFEATGEIFKRLLAGTYQIEIKKTLYNPVTETVEIKAGEPFQKSFQLIPDFGGINISTTPEDSAEVFVNGVSTGKYTPCLLEQLPGNTHEILLKHPWYEPKTIEITVRDGKTTTIEEALTPIFTEVTITTEPETEIFIDNEKRASGTFTGRLRQGYHTFEARLDKHTPDVQKINLQQGSPLTVNLKPTPKQGTLKVVSDPYDAKITLNGAQYGTTPNTINGLLVGDYQLKLEKDGYGMYSEIINIEENKTAEINATLPAGMEVTINSDPQGATLFIDGEQMGVTPATIKLAFGNHRILLEHRNNKLEEDITVTQNGKDSFTFNFIDFGIEMVFVKGGTFTMGCTSEQSDCGDDEKPVHEVTVDDFYIGKYEVTQKQWREVMGNNPIHFSGCDDCPVERVSWNDIQEFIKKLNQLTGKKYRLPTEAEWEYAASGGAERSRSARYEYAGSYIIDEVAWYDGNSDSKAHPVGQKQPNELGIYDMSGNVWEWCSDWYDSKYYRKSKRKAERNPQGPSSGSYHVLRGGSWYFYPRFCRVAHRHFFTPGYRYGSLGFRLSRID